MSPQVNKYCQIQNFWLSIMHSTKIKGSTHTLLLVGFLLLIKLLVYYSLFLSDLRSYALHYSRYNSIVFRSAISRVVHRGSHRPRGMQSRLQRSLRQHHQVFSRSRFSGHCLCHAYLHCSFHVS
jgi:hypothetical protein